jgi:RimJ/RimL family protein N-acetyltransferase
MPACTGCNSRRAEAIRIETERLILDLHRLDQFEHLAQMWADEAVTRYIGAPSTPQESWARLLRYRGLWPLLGYGYWALTEKRSGRFVGDLGFADFYRPVTPSLRGLPEAGWVLARWAHGQGFAGEALGAALTWLDECSPHHRSVCLIAPENEASVKVARRGGFRFDRTVQFLGNETSLFVRERPAGG